MKSFAYFIAAAVAAGICFGTGALWAKRKPDLTATAAQPRPKERGVLRFAPSAPQLAMLAIAPVPTMPVPLAEPLNARVAFDESHTARVSSPISGRIVELRGPLGPGGAQIYRIRIPRKPKSMYIELREDQLIPIPTGKTLDGAAESPPTPPG